MTSRKKLITIFIAIVLTGFGLLILLRQANQPTKLDSLARCLKERGAKFYGAFWCPHCQNQKSLFASAANLLPFVECSTADGQAQLDVCKQEKISSYPTWKFADGSVKTGELSLDELSRFSSCQIIQ